MSSLAKENIGFGQANLLRRMIYNIRVFTGEDSDLPILMFWLQPVRPDQIQDQ